MSTESNKTIIRRVGEEAFNRGKMTVVDEFFSSNHTSSGVGLPPNQPPGPAGVKQGITTYRKAFPDLHLTLEDQIAEGDKVVTRWTVHGTHKGELNGIPPTGKSVTITGLTIDRFANGKVVETFILSDQLGLMQQLGVVPTLAESRR